MNRTCNRPVTSLMILLGIVFAIFSACLALKTATALAGQDTLGPALVAGPKVSRGPRLRFRLQSVCKLFAGLRIWQSQTAFAIAIVAS